MDVLPAFRRKRMMNLLKQLMSGSRPSALMLPQSVFFFLFFNSLHNHFRTTSQAQILSAAKTELKTADVEYMKKIVPFVTCEIICGQYVCELMFGVDVPNLNLGIQIFLVRQPI